MTGPLEDASLLPNHDIVRFKCSTTSYVYCHVPNFQNVFLIFLSVTSLLSFILLHCNWLKSSTMHSYIKQTKVPVIKSITYWCSHGGPEGNGPHMTVQLRLVQWKTPKPLIQLSHADAEKQHDCAGTREALNDADIFKLLYYSCPLLWTMLKKQITDKTRYIIWYSVRTSSRVITVHITVFCFSATDFWHFFAA